MDIKKLNETIEKALKEDFSFDEVCKNEFQLYCDKHYIDLNDYIPDDVEYLKSVAESYDYKIYDNSIVLDVKGRPYIDGEKAGLDFYKDEDCKRVQYAVEFFAQDMERIFGDDFVILGRSGGYWGFDNPKLEITAEGIENLKDAFPEFVKKSYDELDEEDKESFDINNEDDVADIAGRILSGTFGDFDEFVYAKLTYEDIDLAADIKENMETLSNLIDEEEKAMNTKKYWEEV